MALARSGYIDADTVLEADGDINDRHTALPLRQIRCLCEGCGRGIEIVHNGNELPGLSALRFAKELGQLDRVILGTDARGLRRAAARSRNTPPAERVPVVTG